MKKINKIFDNLLLAIYIIFICLFIKNIFFKVTVKYAFSYFLIIGISVGVYFFIKKVKIKSVFKILMTVILVLLSLIGVLCRIYLANNSYIEPYSDYGTFYINAINFSESFKFISTSYIALFPYLTGYMMALGLFFKAFSVCYANVVIFNLIIDICSAVLIFVTFRKKSNFTALLFMTIWLINPLNIIWCSFVYPMSLVNFFLVLGICFFEKFEKTYDNKKCFYIYNIIQGCILALGSMFKPIFIIFIIAIFINRMYTCIFKENVNKFVIIIGLLLLCCSYGVVRTFINMGVEKINGIEISSTQGWTLYLGGNVNSNGAWNEADSNYLIELLRDNSEENTQKILRDAALQRYKDNGIISNLRLMKNKFNTLTCALGQYTYAGFMYIQEGISNELIMSIIKYLLSATCFIIVLSNIYIVLFRKNMENKIIYMLLAIGLITAHLFVEVSERYSLQAYIPMMFLSFKMINDLRSTIKK